MSPYSWRSASAHWFNVWRSHIANAYDKPLERHGYCWAAVIAQAECVMAEALEAGRFKRENQDKR